MAQIGPRRAPLEAQLAKLCDTARRDLEARSDACCDAALRNLAERDAFADLPAAEEDESHGGLVVERARLGLWEPLCDDLSTKFRGPRREARLVDAAIDNRGAASSRTGRGRGF